MKKDTTNKKLSKVWAKYPDDFRIAAVIHDGQWYNKEKWLKISKIKDPKVLDEWIEKNNSKLIKLNDSYRVDKDSIISWYKENNLDIKAKLVPKNFPPRIWDNKTETQGLIDNPLRLTSYITFRMPNETLYKKVERIIKPYSRIYVHGSKKVYAYTLSGEFLRQKLRTELSIDEYAILAPRVRSGFYRREIMDFTDDFLSNAIIFYQTLALTMLKPHKKTLDIFLPGRNDLMSQINEWVILALQKFDEKEPVPFSGYLAAVLTRWPYDLPDYELGREQATYQRKRNRFVENFIKVEGKEPTVEDIREGLSDEYSKEKFDELETVHDQWTKIKMLQSYSHAGVDNQTDTKNAFVDVPEISYEEKVQIKNKIAKAFLRASLKSKCYIEGVELLDELNKSIFDSNKINELPQKFKTSLYEELYPKQQVTEKDEEYNRQRKLSGKY